MYVRGKIESGEVIPTDGGGWQCNKNCCILVENMRTSLLSNDKGKHDRKHNRPGIWTGAPNLLGGVQRFYCSKCPGTRGVGMMDFVKAPSGGNLTVSAPFHSFTPSKIKRHVEVSGRQQKNLRSILEF